MHSPELKAWLATFIGESRADDAMPRVLLEISSDVIARVPQIGEDPFLVDALNRSCEALRRAYVEGQDTTGWGPELPQEAADFARAVAHRRHDLAVLLKVYRVSSRLVWRYLTTVIERLPRSGPTPEEVLVFLWTQTTRWIDHATEEMTRCYYEAREQALGGDKARRLETIEAILSGSPVRSEEVSQILGHNILDLQLGFVLWGPDSSGVTIQALYDAADRVATVLTTSRPLTMAGSGRDLWCWVTTPTAPDPTAATEHADLLPAGVRLALGSAERGIDGFRNTNAEARAAQRLAMSSTRAPQALSYDRVALLCLVEGKQDQVRRLVRTELRDLAGEGKGLTQLRETVLTYLTLGSNVDLAAEQLYVHRNTVRYRLNRAEELLGRPIQSRTAYLELALQHVAYFGLPGRS